jgi:spore coat protein A
MMPITETVAVGDTEIWELYNYTMDAHPIHIHEVQFEVVNREVFDPMLPNVGEVRPPEAWETGFKDTVIAYPGEITRVKAHFDLAGLYVWHCHIVEHEDNEMMRPYRIVHRALLPSIQSNS